MNKLLLQLIIWLSYPVAHGGQVSVGLDLASGYRSYQSLDGLSLTDYPQGRSDVTVLFPVTSRLSLGPMISGYAVGHRDYDISEANGYSFGGLGRYNIGRVSLGLGVSLGSLSSEFVSQSHLSVNGRFGFTFYRGDVVSWDVFAQPSYHKTSRATHGNQESLAMSYGIGVQFTPSFSSHHHHHNRSYHSHHISGYHSYQLMEVFARVLFEVGPELARSVARAL